MTQQIIVQKHRHNTVYVDLGVDISADTFASEIRTEPNQDAPLIEEWAVSFFTDGTDGWLVLELTSLLSGQITASSGYMDIKRTTSGVDYAVFDAPIEVKFQGTITE